ncbi:hypothetical protein F2Q69_00011864 [Brassica cretica]|uniref:Uncharacterized protein n=1 Tax=Brassica cretica TaxID=69181 RepID=A0A8S9R5D8_BRACR|nr:hypothetical protein F2Q69_00011864 [Brassica cretica]
MVGSRGMKLLQRRSRNNYTTGFWFELCLLSAGLNTFIVINELGRRIDSESRLPVELSDFKTVWSIKKQDLDMKERLSKINLLDSLIGKQGPLADYEEALKKKLVDELMSRRVWHCRFTESRAKKSVTLYSCLVSVHGV